MRRIVSNIAVALLVLYALTFVVSAASPLWDPPGTLGFTSDYSATVRALSAGGPAERAGLVAGERLHLAATPFSERRFVVGPGVSVPPGTVVHLAIDAPGGLRGVTLTAVPATIPVAQRWALFAGIVASLVFIVVGALLIVARPRPATWGFGLYCLLIVPVASGPLNIPSASLALAATLLYDALQNLGTVGLVLFTLEFPQSFDLPWRRAIRRALPALFVVLALMTLYPDVANLILGRGARIENFILQCVFGLLVVLSVSILVDTYRRVEPDERERMRWVLIGFGIGLVLNYAGNTLIFTAVLMPNPPGWLASALVSISVLLPLAVAHAVVRHRVLDIRFVIGQALIFTVLTTALAALFGVFDWLFGSVLEDFRLTRVLSAAVSICVAFGFSRLEHRALEVVEAVFFRKRRNAEARVERSIHALPHARSIKLIEDALVRDVIVTLGIASAAFFRLAADGTFERAAATGWSDRDTVSIDDGDRLIPALRAELRPIDLATLPWQRGDVPPAEREPGWAIPMLSHTELAGFTLYSGHPDGTSLDPKEVTLVERLVQAAGLAFDQLDAEQMRAENERLRATNNDLLARLDEVRRAQQH